MEQIATRVLGYPGKMISGSKSGYRSQFPKNLVVFNSNVCVNSRKIWWGDIDVTLSKETLIELAQEIGETVYVLYEMDGRFQNEDNPKIENHVIRFEPDGSYAIGKKYVEYVTFE